MPRSRQYWHIAATGPATTFQPCMAFCCLLQATRHVHLSNRIFYSPSCNPVRRCPLGHAGAALGEPVHLSDEVEYLGAFLDSTSSKSKNVRNRVSEAITASKLLKPLSSHGSLPSSWKLQVYRSIVQAILMYAMDSVLLTPPQIIRMNAFSFRVMRRIVGLKPTYYHPVIVSTNSPCSNGFLGATAFAAGRAITPGQFFSKCRMQLLGHLLKHLDCPKYQATFMSSGTNSSIRGPNRTGCPKVQWAESEASQRVDSLHSDDTTRPMGISTMPSARCLPPTILDKLMDL